VVGDSLRVRWSHGMPKIFVYILEHVGFHALHLADIALFIVLHMLCI
jgi:hypothetical protein